MFRKAYRLPFTLLGIPVFLDVTFLIILPIFAWSIGRQVGLWAQRMGVEDHPSLHHAWVPYALGLVTAIGLFASVLIHELGHSVTARLYHVKVRRITLWLLGGMAEFDEMPRQRGAEAVVAIAGPITSVLVAALCFVALMLTPPSWIPARFVFHSLLSMNIVLAVFNLIPALPLDGGRVLRSLLALKMSHLRATQIASGVAKVLAIMLGLFGLFSGDFMLVLIAFFVYMAGSSEVRNSMVVELLQGVRVADLMTPRVTTVPADLTVGELAQTMVREHQHGFPVVDGNQVVGMVSLDDLQGAHVPGNVRVDQVMRPQVYTVRPDAPALDALQRMSRNKASRLLVVDPAGRMVGTITNTDLMRAIEVRTMGLEWGVPDGDGKPDRVVVQH
jgi:Zn-dependent protease/predicted transcriptional regulator